MSKMVINNLSVRVMKRALIRTVEHHWVGCELSNYERSLICSKFWDLIKDHCELKEENEPKTTLARESSGT